MKAQQFVKILVQAKKISLAVQALVDYGQIWLGRLGHPGRDKTGAVMNMIRDTDFDLGLNARLGRTDAPSTRPSLAA